MAAIYRLSPLPIYPGVPVARLADGLRGTRRLRDNPAR
jgi:hypothetical protein